MGLNYAESLLKAKLVVKEDILILEKTGYNGHYHVLNGLISPLDGITAEDLNIDSLLQRVSNIEEIVLGIEPSSEGDVTILYLAELLKKYEIKVSRLARGIPIGGHFDYIDEITLTRALDERIEI